MENTPVTKRSARSRPRPAALNRTAGSTSDAVTDADLTEPPQPIPALTMEDLERVIASPPLLPPGIEVKPMDEREYGFRQPGLAEPVRVTTNLTYYEQNADSVELWSRGNPTFPTPEDAVDAPLGTTLSEVLAENAALQHPAADERTAASTRIR